MRMRNYLGGDGGDLNGDNGGGGGLVHSGLAGYDGGGDGDDDGDDDDDDEDEDPAMQFCEYSFQKIPRNNCVRRVCIKIVLTP